jgi:RNA polymerase II subunit A small phosphatase-like protein
MENADNKILLILDIDETLIHATSKPLSRKEDFMVFNYFVYKRPYLEEFLINIQKEFKIAFWSSASDDYVEEIIGRIYPLPSPREFVWGRSRCTPLPELYDYESRHYNGFSHYNYIKRLHKLKRKGYRLERVLMVDDTPSKIKNSYGNAIYIKEFTGNEKDIHLLKLQNLMTLKDKSNVRIIEKRGWDHTSHDI